MVFDSAACERARLSRDPRFDGRFFMATSSTGTYCRPICPSQPANRAHVSYYPTAAAAEEAGFHPCRRCRPETAPGTPAWTGTATTVNRGLRLIAEGAVDEGGIEALADRLGITSRHLDRLFVRHLGASPLAVIQTRRLQFAKKLLDETDLSMTQIAFAAGYGSIRRFNDNIVKTYGHPPSLLRKTRPSVVASDSGQYTFRLAYRPPYDWDALMGLVIGCRVPGLAGSVIPGVESFRTDLYRRTIALNGHQGIIEIRPEVEAHTLILRIRFPDPASLWQIVTRVRRTFDLDADPLSIVQDVRHDPLLVTGLSRYPGLRAPGAWDGFQIAVSVVLGNYFPQSEVAKQIGLFVQRYGQPLNLPDSELDRIYPSPEILATSALKGIPMDAAYTIQALAQQVVNEKLCIGPVTSPETLQQQLQDVAGINESMAQFIVMRALNDPDILPVTDPHLLKAAGNGRSLAPELLQIRAEMWRPWRSYGTVHSMYSAYAK